MAVPARPIHSSLRVDAHLYPSTIARPIRDRFPWKRSSGGRKPRWSSQWGKASGPRSCQKPTARCLATISEGILTCPMPLITRSRLCRLRLESAAKLHLWCSANPTVQRVACLAQRSRRLATSAAPTGPENRELKKSQPTAAASSALRHRALRTDEYEKVKEILSRHVSRKDLGAEWTNYKFTSLSIKFRVLSEVQKEFKGVHLGNADITNIVDVRSLISAVRNAPRTPRNEFSDADPVEALFWKLAAQQRLPANLYFKGAKGAPARQGPPATTAPAAEADVEHKGVPNE